MALFRQQFYPGTGERAWNDWHWQLENRLVTTDLLKNIVSLGKDEKAALANGAGLPFAITPYLAALIWGQDEHYPLRRMVIPSCLEKKVNPGERWDPLEEERHRGPGNVIHRYPDRLVLLATNCCAVYCRYCTRSRLVGKQGHVNFWEEAATYIEAHGEIRDVLISGGDPLVLEDEQLELLLKRIRRIPHVEIIRLGTKVPAVLPQRITPRLVAILKRFHPLFMSLHVTHPEELTPEMKRACDRLADAGIPLGSQTVLLAGINDQPETIKRLMQGLLTFRVRPYYLYQCDPIPGSAHFRTPVSRGLEMISQLRGHTSGYAVPSFVIDAPGGGGKIPLLPDSCLGYDGSDLLLRNYEGRTYRYPEKEENAPEKRRTRP
jgi:lysine 2,3-aminomutase